MTCQRLMKSPPSGGGVKNVPFGFLSLPPPRIYQRRSRDHVIRRFRRSPAYVFQRNPDEIEFGSFNVPRKPFSDRRAFVSCASALYRHANVNDDHGDDESGVCRRTVARANTRVLSFPSFARNRPWRARGFRLASRQRVL